MMISTKGRYALRLMLDLASQDPQAYIPLKEITERQNISTKYLEAILTSLVKANFVVGIRGKGGGYRLTKKPTEYTIGSILKAAEGSLAPVSCLQLDNPPCMRQSECPTRPIWKKLDEIINDYLESITLDTLLHTDKSGGYGNCIL